MPNGVLHLACFITLCECLLGIHPHFELWRFFFEVELHRENGVVPDCDGAIIRPRADAGYFDIAMPHMRRSWKQGWFYASDLPKEITEVGLLPFENPPTVKRLSWGVETDLISIETGLLVQEVYQLQDSGLGGMQILKTWLERNILPLAARAHPMFEYKGPSNPCRLNRVEISRSELKSWMHFVTHVPLDEITLEAAVEPFHRGHHPENVSPVLPPASCEFTMSITFLGISFLFRPLGSSRPCLLSPEDCHWPNWHA